MKVKALRDVQYHGLKRKGTVFDHDRAELFIHGQSPALEPVDKVVAAVEPEPEEKKPDLSSVQKEQMLQDAIYKLDPKNDDFWTAQGLVRTSEIEDIVGFEVSRSDIQQAVGDFTREDALKKASGK